ncbi:YrzI family small protein [Bacillus sp. 165]|nr:YrzI family small protein [Bacillus sp. 165]MBO9128610.1 YrzI family small protein [Bacillus sp. 165]
MTFTFLFFTITIQKRHVSDEDIERNAQVQKLGEEMLDRQCSVYRSL